MIPKNVQVNQTDGKDEFSKKELQVQSSEEEKCVLETREGGDRPSYYVGLGKEFQPGVPTY